MPGPLPSTSLAAAARRAGRISEAIGIVDAETQRTELMEGRTAADYFEWGLCYEFAGLESTSLGTLITAFNLATVSGDPRIAFEAAGQLAWLHALCGRGRDADLWLERAKARAATAGPARRGADVLAEALRAADALRPDLAVELVIARATGAEDELRLIALAQSAVFRYSAGAAPDALLDELRQAEEADGALLVEYGENLVVVRYTEGLLQLAAQRPALAVERLDGVAARGGEPFVIGLRALAHLAAGDAAAALRDADRAFAYYHQWPRILIPAGLVKALLAAETGDRRGAAAAFVAACRIADENAIPSALLNVPPEALRRLAAIAGADELPDSVREMLRTTA